MDDVVIASLAFADFLVNPKTGKLNPVMFTALQPEITSTINSAPPKNAVRDLSREMMWCCVTRIGSALFPKRINVLKA
jgi:hypothetical protein